MAGVRSRALRRIQGRPGRDRPAAAGLAARTPAAALAIFPTAATGPFGVPDLEFGNLLVPHLALGYRLLAENRRHQALADAIDRFPTGVALLDARGHLLLANRGARQIF